MGKQVAGCYCSKHDGPTWKKPDQWRAKLERKLSSSDRKGETGREPSDEYDDLVAERVCFFGDIVKVCPKCWLIFNCTFCPLPQFPPCHGHDSTSKKNNIQRVFKQKPRTQQPRNNLLL